MNLVSTESWKPTLSKFRHNKGYGSHANEYQMKANPLVARDVMIANHMFRIRYFDWVTRATLEVAHTQCHIWHVNCSVSCLTVLLLHQYLAQYLRDFVTFA